MIMKNARIEITEPIVVHNGDDFSENVIIARHNGTVFQGVDVQPERNHAVFTNNTVLFEGAPED